MINWLKNNLELILNVLGIITTFGVGVVFSQNHNLGKRFRRIEQMLEEGFGDVEGDIEEMIETLDGIYQGLRRLENRADNSGMLQKITIGLLIVVIILITFVCYILIEGG